MTWWQLFLIIFGSSLSSTVLVIGTLRYIAPQVIYKILDRYEDRVNRQSLAEARRLIDANRQYPAWPNANGTARVHRAKIK